MTMFCMITGAVTGAASIVLGAHQLKSWMRLRRYRKAKKLFAEYNQQFAATNVIR